MTCKDCGKKADKIISIEIVLYKNYEKIEKLTSIDFCLNCFKKTPEGSFLDERMDLERIINDTKKNSFMQEILYKKCSQSKRGDTRFLRNKKEGS